MRSTIYPRPVVKGSGPLKEKGRDLWVERVPFRQTKRESGVSGEETLLGPYIGPNLICNFLVFGGIERVPRSFRTDTDGFVVEEKLFPLLFDGEQERLLERQFLCSRLRVYPVERLI